MRLRSDLLTEALAPTVRTSIEEGRSALADLELRSAHIYNRLMGPEGEKVLEANPAELSVQFREMSWDIEQAAASLFHAGPYLVDPRVTTITTMAGRNRMLANRLHEGSEAAFGISQLLARARDGVVPDETFGKALRAMLLLHTDAGAGVRNLSWVMHEDDALRAMS